MARTLPTHSAGAPALITPPVQSCPAWTRWLLVTIVLCAVLAPPVTLVASLPDVRAEQVLALPALGWLLARIWRQGRTAGSIWTLGRTVPVSPVDVGFAVLALATLASIVYAPLVLGEPAGPRDGYEIVKLALYWTLFRFALVVGGDSRARRAALLALLTAGSVSALLAVAQYLGAHGIGQDLAQPWTPEHHLRVLDRDGRAPGTLGNANYFSAAMALLATVAIATLSFRRYDHTISAAAFVAVAAGALGVVLSGSRGALGMLVVSTAVAGALMLGRAARASPRRLAGGGNRGRSTEGQEGMIGVQTPPSASGLAPSERALRPIFGGLTLLVGAFVLAVVLVQVVPRGRQDYLARVAGALSPTGDTDLALRLERWRGLTGTHSTASPDVPGLPISGTGLPSSGADARGRDALRKDAVGAVANAVRRFRTMHGALPSTLDDIDVSIVLPRPADPTEPATLDYKRIGSGFTIAVRLEDASDPDFPVYAVGDGGNLLANGDIEEGGDGATAFRALPGTVYRRAPEAALYGGRGIVFRGNPEHSERRAAVYQQRHLVRSGGELTASVWVLLPVAPERGTVELYTNLYYTDGTRDDPHVRVSADPSQIGVWQRLVVPVRPAPGLTVDFIGVYLLTDGFSGEAWADGFELVDGPLPLAFTGLREQPASANSLDAGARFRRSPVFGTGPGKAADAGTADNEYLTVLARYGLVGLSAYLALWLVTLVCAVRRGTALGAAVAGVVAGLLLFNLVAGSLYHLQLMAILWPVIGLALARSD